MLPVLERASRSLAQWSARQAAGRACVQCGPAPRCSQDSGRSRLRHQSLARARMKNGVCCQNAGCGRCPGWQVTATSLPPLIALIVFHSRRQNLCVRSGAVSRLVKALHWRPPAPAFAWRHRIALVGPSLDRVHHDPMPAVCACPALSSHVAAQSSATSPSLQSRSSSWGAAAQVAAPLSVG